MCPPLCFIEIRSRMKPWKRTLGGWRQNPSVGGGQTHAHTRAHTTALWRDKRKEMEGERERDQLKLNLH